MPDGVYCVHMAGVEWSITDVRRMTTPPTQPTAPSIGHSTARGFVWLAGQGIGEKVVTLAGQVALARLLSKDDFKLVALTYTVTTFAALFQQAGIGQVLIQRHRRFRLWATTAFWMSLAIGLAVGLLTAAVAPAVAAFYQEPALKGLLWAAAVTLPLNALITVPDAKLRGEMRFRFIAVLGMAAIVATMALSIALAALGFGPYSFILPPVAVTVVRAGVMWWWARPRVLARLHLGRWKYLLTDSAMLVVGSVAMMVTYQGGQVILGRLYPALAAAGVFYFAWNLSDQSLRLLVNNLSGVLFPALSTMQDDPARQRAAFLRSTRVLMLVGLPICLLQAVVAEPLVRLVFGAKWVEAAPVMAALCIGMSARLVQGPSESLMLARRRYRSLMVLSLVYAAVYVAVVTAGAVLAGEARAATGAALGAAVCLVALGPVSLACALGRAAWRDIVSVYAVPVLVGACAFAPGLALTTLFAPTTAGNIGALGAVGSVTMATYGLGAWLLARTDVRDVAERLAGLLRRQRRESSKIPQP
jgi:PST family polysaccharide transporter